MGWSYDYTNLDKGRLPFSREEITEVALRTVWNDNELEYSSQGRGFKEQLTREHSDLVCELSHEASLGQRESSMASLRAVLYGLWQACYSWPLRNTQEPFQEAWESASIEEKGWIAMATIRGVFHAEWPGIPRVSSGVKDRVHRLKALGNGWVPQVVARILQVRL